MRRLFGICLIATLGLGLSAAGVANAAPAPSAQIIPSDRATQRVLTALPSSPAPAAASSYVVRPGDTLSAIAARFCGSAGAFPSLAAASGIRNPDLIYPGRVVTLTCSGARAAVASYSPSAAKAKSTPAAAPAPASSSAGRVVAFALAQVGKPYVWGAAGPSSFDCSGLVVASYRSIGVVLPHFTGDLIHYGTPVSRANLRPGDLVFLSSGHVGLAIGGDRVVAAPQPGERVKTQVIYAYYAGRRIV